MDVIKFLLKSVDLAAGVWLQKVWQVFTMRGWGVLKYNDWQIFWNTLVILTNLISTDGPDK